MHDEQEEISQFIKLNIYEMVQLYETSAEEKRSNISLTTKEDLYARYYAICTVVILNLNLFIGPQHLLGSLPNTNKEISNVD